LRVSEHIPEVVSFIEGIVRNGYGYVDAPAAAAGAGAGASARAGGNVFFDVSQFGRTYAYGALRPTAVSAAAAMQTAPDPDASGASRPIACHRITIYISYTHFGMSAVPFGGL
jgi:hypothetical protein